MSQNPQRSFRNVITNRVNFVWQFIKHLNIPNIRLLLLLLIIKLAQLINNCIL